MASIIRGCCCREECYSGAIHYRSWRHRSGPAPTWAGLAYVGDDLYVNTDPALDELDWREAMSPVCHKLYVWENRPVASNVIGGAADADVVLRTNVNGQWDEENPGVGFGGPFRLTDPDDATLLDDRPYWWFVNFIDEFGFPAVGCVRGGYAIDASPPIMLTTADINANTTISMPDGDYTALVLARCRHWRKRSNDGGDVLIAPSNGHVRAMATVFFIRHL